MDDKLNKPGGRCPACGGGPCHSGCTLHEGPDTRDAVLEVANLLAALLWEDEGRLHSVLYRHFGEEAHLDIASAERTEDGRLELIEGSGRRFFVEVSESDDGPPPDALDTPEADALANHEARKGPWS